MWGRSVKKIGWQPLLAFSDQFGVKGTTSLLKTKTFGIVFCGLVGFCFAYIFSLRLSLGGTLLYSTVYLYAPLGAFLINIHAFTHQKKK